MYTGAERNTEAMANYAREGVKKAGGEADLFTSAEFGADKAGKMTSRIWLPVHGG